MQFYAHIAEENLSGPVGLRGGVGVGDGDDLLVDIDEARNINIRVNPLLIKLRSGCGSALITDIK